MGEAARAVISVRPGYLAAVLALVAIDRMVMILRWILLLRASGVAIEASRAASHLPRELVCRQLPAGGHRRRCRAGVRAVACKRDRQRSARLGRRRSSARHSLARADGRRRPAGLASWRNVRVEGGRTRRRRPVRGCGPVLGRRDRAAARPARWRAHGPLSGVQRAGDAVSRYRQRGAVLVTCCSGRSPFRCCESSRPTCLGSGWASRCRSAPTCSSCPLAC